MIMVRKITFLKNEFFQLMELLKRTVILGSSSSANKFWSGLLEDYYLPRATLYFNEMLKSLRDKKKLEIEKWRREWITMSHKWQQSSSGVYPVKAKGDALAISRHLLRKYFA